jgi:hypothetical protein
MEESKEKEGVRKGGGLTRRGERRRKGGRARE